MFAVAAILPSLAVNPVATLSTSLGDIKVELFLDRVPRTASNFIDLAQSGEACRHHHLGNPPPPPMSTPDPVRWRDGRGLSPPPSHPPSPPPPSPAPPSPPLPPHRPSPPLSPPRPFPVSECARPPLSLLARFQPLPRSPLPLSPLPATQPLSPLSPRGSGRPNPNPDPDPNPDPSPNPSQAFTRASTSTASSRAS